MAAGGFSCYTNLLNVPLNRLTPVKRIAYFLVVGLLLTACSKDKDSITPSLVGKWQFVTVVVSATIQGKATSRTENYTNKDDSYEFKGDGTYIGRSVDSTVAGVRTLTEAGTYRTAGNQLTLTTQDSTSKAVKNTYLTYELSGTRLQFTATKESVGKALTEQAVTDLDAQIGLDILKTYDAFSSVLVMRKL